MCDRSVFVFPPSFLPMAGASPLRLSVSMSLRLFPSRSPKLGSLYQTGGVFGTEFGTTGGVPRGPRLYQPPRAIRTNPPRASAKMRPMADSDVTRILADLSAGDRSAAERLLPHVYDELRALAASFFRRRQPNQTLQPTALVHEAFVKMVGSANQNWTSKKHFFSVAAMAMRQLLTDRARRVAAEKRGGGAERVTLADEASPIAVGPDIDIIAIDEALAKLSGLDPRQARIVELRFLAGLSVDETAEVLDISPRTVKLDWQMARSFLRRELGPA
jgi:RNA polymerase sigma-70 factor (ECF subfamily)